METGRESGSGRMPNVYDKLRDDGTADSQKLQDLDYENLIKFIKSSFPSSLKVKRETEETLKRTFVLGRGGAKGMTGKRKKTKNNQAVRGKRNMRFRATKSIPPILPYSDFLELNNLWKAYITDILRGEKKVLDIQQRLNRADLHGAFLKVVESRCDSFVGLEGIVIAETKNTFCVISPSSRTRMLPKSESIFEVSIPEPSGVMRISGNAFVSRPAERSSKKIKSFIDFHRPTCRKSSQGLMYAPN